MSIGCCGSRDVARLAGLADLYPRSTREGQRARARLALAMVGARARARGDLAMIARVERGLASLGTTGDRAAAVRAAVAAVRSSGSTASGATPAAQLAAERVRAGSRAQRDIDTALAFVQGAVGVARGIADGVARSEASKAAAEGRVEDATARDTAKVFAWINWMLGSAEFPPDVAESDLRIFNTIINNEAITAITDGGLTVAIAAAATNPPVQTFLVWLKGHLRRIRESTAAAVRSLPAPSAPPAEPPPAETPPRPLFARRDLVTLLPADRRYIDFVRCPDGSYASSAAQCPSSGKKGGGVLLALPAALLAWYLFK